MAQCLQVCGLRLHTYRMSQMKTLVPSHMLLSASLSVAALQKCAHSKYSDC